ncbi:MAG TPA: winged helix-turn-helix domain-containing protein [Solirubrobacterales bacterium]
MHTIELSDATYRRLLRRSTAFGDTPEDVILRLLEEAGDGDPLRREEIKEAGRKAPRATPGSILPEREYWRPILSVLVERGGSAPASDVIEAVGERLKGSFTPLDLEQLDTGAVRWRNRTRFARLRMTQQGLLERTSHRGIWEITDDGRTYLKRLREVERSA